MKIEITYACGHTGTIEVYGDRRQRERQIWVAENWTDCPDCQAADNAAKAESAKAAGLPELTGSEKQISWALDLRNTALTWAQGYVDDIVAEHGENSLEARVIHASYDEYAGHCMAKYWIEGRNHVESTFIKIINRLYEQFSRDEQIAAMEAE